MRENPSLAPPAPPRSIPFWKNRPSPHADKKLGFWSSPRKMFSISNELYVLCFQVFLIEERKLNMDNCIGSPARQFLLASNEAFDELLSKCPIDARHESSLLMWLQASLLYQSSMNTNTKCCCWWICFGWWSQSMVFDLTSGYNQKKFWCFWLNNFSLSIEVLNQKKLECCWVKQFF